MPRYRYIVKALSPRDGGWVRLRGYYQTEEEGWQFYCLFFPFMVLSADYITVTVERTIVFRAHHHINIVIDSTATEHA